MNEEALVTDVGALMEHHMMRPWELMAAGAKPLAYFVDLTEERADLFADGFRPLVEAGGALRRVVVVPAAGRPLRDGVVAVLYALPAEAWWLDAAERRLRDFHKRQYGFSPGADWAWGWLLGCPEAAIAAFLERQAVRRAALKSKPG